MGPIEHTLQFKNDNYSTSIQEHAVEGTEVIQVALHSPPSGGVTYSFASGNHDNAFTIDNNGK